MSADSTKGGGDALPGTVRYPDDGIRPPRTPHARVITTFDAEDRKRFRRAIATRALAALLMGPDRALEKDETLEHARAEVARVAWSFADALIATESERQP